MRVLHSSDLHGDYEALLAYKEPFDIWIDSGDFFPNTKKPLGMGTILPTEERNFQLEWCGYKDLGPRLTDWLDGRPAIICPGNHDFIPLYGVLAHAKANAYSITTSGIAVGNKLWAGFREIPYMAGIWEGEVKDFSGLIDSTWYAVPDILVTHAPPKDILSGHWGISKLTSALQHREHDIKHHFFGHVHEAGGTKTYINKVWYYNGARHVRAHDLEF